jgi:hypothetical protein
MTLAALPSTLFQRLNRFLRSDLEASTLAVNSRDELVVVPEGSTAEPATPAPVQETHIPEPAQITVFEKAGTTASPIIRWATATEPSTACFNLERSTDGQQWRSVHLTAATGSLHRGATYSVPVQATREGRQLFRVRQTLLDGTALLSEILELEAVAEAPARVSILPGRVSDFLHLRLADPQPASITVRDARGVAVTGTVVHGAAARVDLGGVAPGIYFLHFLQAGMDGILRFEKE